MTHQYSTLKHDSIRLLELFPPSTSSNPKELKCALVDCSLSSPCSYEALSYTWGQPVFPEKLHTQSGTLNITENLASALRSLRLQNEVRCLWVDAVCINQKDTMDKNRQVAMMGKIYKTASRALCWLGHSETATAAVMDTLRSLAASASTFGITELYHGYKEKADFSGHTKAQEAAFRDLAPKMNFDALARFYSNPYFTRLWIIQEVTLSQDSILVMNTCSITYSDFAWATAVLKKFQQTFAIDTYPLTITTLSKAWEIVSIRLVFTRKRDRDVLTDAELRALNDNQWRPDWMTLRVLDIIDAINSECSDSRDRIYGLLSLINDENSDDIRMDADYTKSTDEVYTDFSRAYLLRKEIRILNHAGLQRTNPYREQINSTNFDSFKGSSFRASPSWVPDWRVPKPYMALGGSKRPGFRAGFDLPIKVEAVPNSSSKIYISGSEIDRVKHVFQPIDLNPAHSDLPPRFETHEATRASIVALQARCESHYYNVGRKEYATGEGILTAFVRTVLADGVYSAFGSLFPAFKGSPDMMVILWRLFKLLKIKPDDGIDLPSNIFMPNLQTAEPGTSREQSVRTAWTIVTFMITALSQHALFITESGYLGLGPALTLVGDSVALFGGAEIPFMLRSIKTEGGNGLMGKEFCILGDCYLHGFMYGELLTDDHRARTEMFAIS